MENQMDYQHLIAPCTEIARAAGLSILEVYRGLDFGIQTKSDDSPVTIADQSAHQIIKDGLTPLLGGIPILSEEGDIPPYEVRKHWQRYWLVDPLDGTREFINRNDQFSINIALIESGQPVLGILFAPAMDMMAYATKNGAFVEMDGLPSRQLMTSAEDREEIRVVCSRSYIHRKTRDYINTLSDPKVIPVGSALKFLWLALEWAEVYPRYGTTMEWDTAAPQIILEAAGGLVVDIETQERLTYNKAQLENPDFLAVRHKSMLS